MFFVNCMILSQKYNRSEENRRRFHNILRLLFTEVFCLTLYTVIADIWLKPVMVHVRSCNPSKLTRPIFSAAESNQ